MSMETERSNASWHMDKALKYSPDPASELTRSAYVVESSVAYGLSRYHRQVAEAEEQSKELIHKHLSELVALGDYPYRHEGFAVTTGTGPTTITIEVEYSGVSSWFFGLWKSKHITLKATIHYGLKEEEFEKNFRVADKRGNSREIATFLKSVVGRAYQLAKELGEKNPLYADASGFESELVLKTSELVADPSVAAIYTQLNEIDKYKKDYEKQLDEIILKAKEESRTVSAAVKELQTKIKERWETYEKELAKVAQELKDKLAEIVQTKKAAIEEEANKERDAALNRVLKEVEGEKRKVERKINALQAELEKMKKRKGNVTEATRELLVKMDRWFPDYDFGRNSKLDEEDVTPHLRAECARKVGRIISKDPDIYTSNAARVLEFMVRNIRRSAGQKFNGKDMRAITEEVCWLLTSVAYSDLRWIMERLGQGYNRYTVPEIHSLAESLIPKKEESVQPPN